MTNTLPAPEPVIDPDTREFWAATTKGVLLYQRCNSCQQTVWMPRALCPACHGDDLSLHEASGKGTVYSFTEVAKGMAEYAGAGPYVLAYVELEEGPRVMTNIVDYDSEQLKIGDAVEVVFHQANDEAALPRFRPAAA